MQLPLTIEISGMETIETNALLDSGAGGVFINEEYARQLGLRMIPLPKPIIAQNVDGTPNKQGEMTHYVLIYIVIRGRKLLTRAHIIGLGRESLILGLPWLQRYNPMIDWKMGSFHFRNEFQKTAI